MSKYKFLLLLICGLSSCSTPKENTYEENFTICSRKFIYPKADDNTGFKEKFNLDECLECMKGSLGPDFIVRTKNGNTISTKPANGKAMVLYFWFITKGAPPEFERSDAEDIEAMNLLYHKFSSKVDFLGFPFNDSTTARQYLQKHPLDFPQMQNKTTAEKEFDITQGHNPFAIFIDTQGKVVKINKGSFGRKNLIIEKYSPIIRACIENKPYIN